MARMRFKKASEQMEKHKRQMEFIFNKVRENQETHTQLLARLTESDQGKFPHYTNTPMRDLPRWRRTYLWGYRDALHSQNEKLIDSRWAIKGTEIPLTAEMIQERNIKWSDLYYLGFFWVGTDKVFYKYNDVNDHHKEEISG